MKRTLSEQLKQFLRVLQGALFPTLREELGPLTVKCQRRDKTTAIPPVM
jgi:hypothetical protein